MGPLLLIVADPRSAREVADRVRALGYAVDQCAPRELNRRVRMGDPPDAVLLSSDDGDASLLLAGLRRSRRGASIPVLVFGAMGGDVSDLADVLDLGGDGFVPMPLEDAVLLRALDELVGPPDDPPAETEAVAEAERLSSRRPESPDLPPSFSPPPSRRAEVRASDDEGSEREVERPSWRRESTDVLDERGRVQERRFIEREPDPPAGSNAVLGQLHATLDRLEARLRDDSHGEADEELDSYGFDDIPDVEPEGEELDPDDSSSSMSLPEPEPESPRARRERELERRRASANRVDFREPRAEREPPRPSRRPHPGPSHAPEPEGVEEFTGGESFTDLSVLREERATRERKWTDARDEEPPRQGEAPRPSRYDDDFEREPRRERPRSSRRAEERRPPESRRRPPAASHRRRRGEDDEAPERSAVLRPRRPERSEPRRAASTRSVPAAPVAEHGNLRDKPLAELLWGLHGEGFTGRVSLRQARDERDFWVEKGELIFARSNVGSERLVDSLLRRGVLTRPQYETARRLAAKEPRRAGELLVEAGFIKPRELESVVRDHLARLVEAAFTWDEGSWETRGGEQVYETVSLDMSMRRLLLDGVRAGASAAQLRSWLGARVLRPQLSARGARRDDMIRRLERELALLPEELRWLEDFTGEFGVPELLRGHRDEVGLLALIYVLNLSGEVELLGPKKAKMASRDPAQIDADRVSDRLRLAREADYFELLGVGREAARAEIRRAYTELRATFAEEQVEEETRQTMGPQLAELRAALAEARDILVDDAMRSAYLAHLDVALAAEPSET